MLKVDIAAFIEAHNENPKHYKWINSSDEILTTVERICQHTQLNLCGELQVRMTSKVYFNYGWDIFADPLISQIDVLVTEPEPLTRAEPLSFTRRASCR